MRPASPLRAEVGSDDGFLLQGHLEQAGSVQIGQGPPGMAVFFWTYAVMAGSEPVHCDVALGTDPGRVWRRPGLSHVSLTLRPSSALTSACKQHEGGAAR